MRKFMFVPVLLLLVGFLMTGCKGEKSAGAKEEASAEKKVEKASEEENPKLTEKELLAFMKAFPVFVDITRKKGKEIEPLAEKDNLLSGMKMAGELEEYAEEVDKALKDYGFTLESFSAAHVKVMSAFAYGKLSEAMDKSKEQMKQMLNNPNMPEEQKEEIRKGLEDLEESEEIKANKENWEIVKKHEEELTKLFEELEEEN